MSREMLVIGGGAMAHAILSGAEAAGTLPDRVCVVDPNADRRALFREAAADIAGGLGWLAAADPDAKRGAVMLAVKPQMLGEVAEQIRACCGEAGIGPRLAVSVLAGTLGSQVRRAMGPESRVVRVMPNTPARIRRGTSAVAVSEGATAVDADWVRSLFRGVGDVVVDLDESLMDAFTAVAGSGPAYVFYLAEAMERAATEVGLPADIARAIVTETIAGAAELQRQSGESPHELRASVTSKRGTTAAATGVFDDVDLSGIVGRAVMAARDRGRTLAAEATPRSPADPHA